MKRLVSIATSRLRATPSMQGLPYWIAAVATGAVAVLYSQSHIGAHEILHFVLEENPSWIFIISPLLLFLSWTLIHFLCRGAAGSGIPQVLAVFEAGDAAKRKKSVRKILGLRVWLVKICSSIGATAGGGALGIEGPMIQLGAGIFFSIGTRFQKIWAQLKPEYFFVAGAGAGIAAAFNTPLGGIVYAIEEFTSAQLHRFKTVLITAVIIAGMTSQSMVGSYLYLGFPKIEAFDYWIMPWVLLLAVLCGIWGAIFGRIVHSLSRWRAAKMDSNFKKGLLAILMGLSLALLYTYVDHRSIGGGRNVVLGLLFDTSADGELKLAIVRFLAPILSYISGVAGGIFAPSLAAGGSMAHFLAYLFEMPSSNLMVLIGMISFLTGVTRLPFTSFVLVLEMTDRHSALFPMMTAAVVANAVARLIDDKTVYEHMMPLFLKHLPLDKELEKEEHESLVKEQVDESK